MTSITYDERVDIDVEGLKYTMDGGADGHTLNSSVDEIIHNIIDFKVSNLDIHNIDEYLWSFQFDINREGVNIIDKLNNGVSLFKTKGGVESTDISKYGKGIKSAAHCIEPCGYMVLGLVVNKVLKMAVYNQKNMTTIKPNTESSETLEKLFKDITNYDLSENKGFLIIAMNEIDFDESFNIFNDKCLNNDEEYEDSNIELVNHIRICYNPYLNINFTCDENYTDINTINMSFNNKKIDSFSHTCFDDENIDDNAEIMFAKEYICNVPYRLIDDKKKYDYSGMYFNDDNDQFTFDIKSTDKNGNSIYEKQFKPNYEDMDLNEEHIDKCIIRITKLSPEAQKLYSCNYNYDKSKSCSYFVYRNGVCSDSSFISFDGEGGYLSYYCPQLRGEIYCNNDFDKIINPGANKSLIHPPEQFCIKLRNLANHIRNNNLKTKKKSEKKFIEGKEYLVLPKNKTMD